MQQEATFEKAFVEETEMQREAIFEKALVEETVELMRQDVDSFLSELSFEKALVEEQVPTPPSLPDMVSTLHRTFRILTQQNLGHPQGDTSDVPVEQPPPQLSWMMPVEQPPPQLSWMMPVEQPPPQLEAENEQANAQISGDALVQSAREEMVPMDRSCSANSDGAIDEGLEDKIGNLISSLLAEDDDEQCYLFSASGERYERAFAFSSEFTPSRRTGSLADARKKFLEAIEEASQKEEYRLLGESLQGLKTKVSTLHEDCKALQKEEDRLHKKRWHKKRTRARTRKSKLTVDPYMQVGASPEPECVIQVISSPEPAAPSSPNFSLASASPEGD